VSVTVWVIGGQVASIDDHPGRVHDPLTKRDPDDREHCAVATLVVKGAADANEEPGLVVEQVQTIRS
jgi:hypothetical protein